LGQQHLLGRIDLQSLLKVLRGRREDLNRAAFDLIPLTERAKHGYLLPKKVDPREGKSPEQLYQEGLVTLLEYDDLKYPERKAAREALEATYPLPEPLHDCVACGEPDKASIKCLHCHRRVCQPCLAKFFPTSGEDAFLTMHHRFCLGFGRPVRHALPPIASL